MDVDSGPCCIIFGVESELVALSLSCRIGAGWSGVTTRNVNDIMCKDW